MRHLICVETNWKQKSYPLILGLPTFTAWASLPRLSIRHTTVLWNAANQLTGSA